ncbi:MAG TPA: carboxypeptidase-like regulatory domain-containing protein [Gemmatimonadaceae bacterium]|nr:carboxypeptidase-like regulatory domain-containing protein [Gemmatimonadaceae bacterium]
MRSVFGTPWCLALAASLTAGLTGCDRLPQGDRKTPDVAGRVVQAGNPVANATIILARAPAGVAVTCGEALVSARTDQDGRFTARAARRWRSSAERPDTDDPLLLCIRGEGDANHDTLFRTMATRWDSLYVECDRARTWLREDRLGSSGQCLITRYALDGQPLAMRIPRFPPRICDTTATEIGPTGIGPLRVFGDIAQLRRVCPGIRDTMFDEVFSMLPGPEPRLVLDIAGEPVIFRNSQGLIADIAVGGSGFRTPEGVRVGMPMSRLAGRADLSAILSDEQGGPYLLAWEGRQCGMAFASGRPGWLAMLGSGRRISMQQLRNQPPTLRVRRIYAGSCIPYVVPGAHGAVP